MLLIDPPLWLFSIIAGIVGYLAGRSRRAAFIAGVLGIFIVDLIHLVRAVAMATPTRIVLGGAGVFDGMVVAGLIAIGLAEFVGEVRERVEGGVKVNYEKEGCRFSNQLSTARLAPALQVRKGSMRDISHCATNRAPRSP